MPLTPNFVNYSLNDIIMKVASYGDKKIYPFLVNILIS